MTNVLIDRPAISIANQAIKQSNKIDHQVASLKLINIMFMLEGWSLTNYNKSLCNYENYYQSLTMYVNLPEIYQEFSDTIGVIKDPAEILNYDKQTKMFRVSNYPTLTDIDPKILANLKQEIYYLLFWDKTGYIINELMNKHEIAKNTKLTQNQIKQIYSKFAQEIVNTSKPRYQEFKSNLAKGLSTQFLQDKYSNELLNRLNQFATNVKLNKNNYQLLTKLINDAYLAGYQKYQDSLDDDDF